MQSSKMSSAVSSYSLFRWSTPSAAEVEPRRSPTQSNPDYTDLDRWSQVVTTPTNFILMRIDPALVQRVDSLNMLLAQAQ